MPQTECSFTGKFKCVPLEHEVDVFFMEDDAGGLLIPAGSFSRSRHEGIDLDKVRGVVRGYYAGRQMHSLFVRYAAYDGQMNEIDSGIVRDRDGKNQSI
ncbi:hypothetical protein KY359_06655 [Candidatus Woesearchaeota archaeon]|nr:hypothetical protein [Candidatus Woesearchaeota archaeon]